MTTNTTPAWSLYVPGSDTALVTATTLALIDAAVPADVVARVWDAARQDGGLAQVVAPLVSSLADLPAFAVVVVDGESPRALVRGDLEVAVGDVRISGRGVATWREETLVADPEAETLEVVVSRISHEGGHELPVLAGVVRASQVTSRLELRPAAKEQATPAVAAEAGAAGEPDSADGDPEPAPADLEVPVLAGAEADGASEADVEADGASEADGAADVDAPDVTEQDAAEGDDADPVALEEPSDVLAEATAEDDHAPQEPLDETAPEEAAPEERPGDEAASDEQEPVVTESEEHAPEPTQWLEHEHEQEPGALDEGETPANETDPVLAADAEPTAALPESELAPVDVTLLPAPDEGGYGFVAAGRPSVVPAMPQVPAIAPVELDTGAIAVVPQEQEFGSAAWAHPGAEADPREAAQSEAPQAPEAPEAAEASLDLEDGDHDGGTILDHEIAGLRDPGLVTVSPWSRPSDQVEVPRLKLSFSHGLLVELDRPVLVGRAPESTAGSEAQLVAVPSPKQDISRTHCEIRLDGEDVLVTDLRSTNGTVVSRPGQVPHRLHPGEGTSASAGSRIDLGDGVVILVES